MSKKEKAIRYTLLTLGILSIGAGVVFFGFEIAIGAIISLTVGVILLFFSLVPYIKRK